MNKKPRSINGLALLAILGLVLVWLIMTGTGGQTSSAKYSQIVSWFEQGEVTDFTLNLKNGEMSLTPVSYTHLGPYWRAAVPSEKGVAARVCHAAHHWPYQK